jgi:hypothetical protein
MGWLWKYIEKSRVKRALNRQERQGGKWIKDKLLEAEITLNLINSSKT